MPEFLPFVGTRYDESRVTMSQVVAPPYDVLSEEQRDQYYDRDDYNVVRLELNRDEDPYDSAAKTLEEWLEAGILRRDHSPAFYVYYQTFERPDGHTVTRHGVIGRLRLVPYSTGEV